MRRLNLIRRKETWGGTKNYILKGNVQKKKKKAASRSWGKRVLEGDRKCKN